MRWHYLDWSSVLLKARFHFLFWTLFGQCFFFVDCFFFIRAPASHVYTKSISTLVSIVLVQNWCRQIFRLARQNLCSDPLCKFKAHKFEKSISRKDKLAVSYCILSQLPINCSDWFDRGSWRLPDQGQQRRISFQILCFRISDSDLAVALCGYGLWHASWGCTAWRFEEKVISCHSWNVRNVGAVSLKPSHNVISCRVWRENHRGGVLTWSPFISQQLPPLAKQQTVAGPAWRQTWTVRLGVGGRVQGPLVRGFVWGVSRFECFYSSCDQTKLTNSTSYNSDNLFSLQLWLFQFFLVVYLGVCFGVFNLFPHTKLIKSGPGPQRSFRFAWREITLLWKDSAWVKGNLLCISVFSYI